MHAGKTKYAKYKIMRKDIFQFYEKFVILRNDKVIYCYERINIKHLYLIHL